MLFKKLADYPDAAAYSHPLDEVVISAGIAEIQMPRAYSSPSMAVDTRFPVGMPHDAGLAQASG